MIACTVQSGRSSMKEDVVVHVWKSQAHEVGRFAADGFQVIFSSCWYLDHINYGPHWIKYYQCYPCTFAFTFTSALLYYLVIVLYLNSEVGLKSPDPSTLLHAAVSGRGEEAEKRVLGGESCMWMEYQDEYSFMARVWYSYCSLFL